MIGAKPLLDYKTGAAWYGREERPAGTSNYPPKNIIHLALEGVTPFPIQPVRLITRLGLIISTETEK